MYRSGLVDTLVTHANTKGFGLTSLSGVSHGFMPPQLKKMNSTPIKKLLDYVNIFNKNMYSDGFERLCSKSKVPLK